METKKEIKSVKEVTDEKVGRPVDQELVDELKVKERQLEENKARLEGGFSKSLGRNYMPLDEEIVEMDRKVRMMEIQIKYDDPINPTYRFEREDEWRELNRQGARKAIIQAKKVLETLTDQKEKITKDIPELEARVGAIKAEIE